MPFRKAVVKAAADIAAELPWPEQSSSKVSLRVASDGILVSS